MTVKFSNLPATLSPEHESCWQGMVDLFFADPRRIGRRLPDALGDDGKPITGPWRYRDFREETRCTVTTHQQATLNVMAMHLSGTLMHGHQRAWLQCYAASDEGQAVYTTIDLDVEGEAHSSAPEHFVSQEAALEAARKLIAEAQALGLVAHLEITKSGGYRVWVFHHRLRAALAQGLGRLLVARAGLHAKTEVFPAQGWLQDGQYGSAVFVPYGWHNARNGRQVMINPQTGEVRLVEEFVREALAGRSDPALIAGIVTGAFDRGELKPPEPRRERAEHTGDSALAETGPRTAGAWQHTYLRCAAIREMVDACDAGLELSYRDWLHLASHLKPYGDAGRGEFHDLSSSDPRYDEAQTDALFDSVNFSAKCSTMGCGRDPQADCGLPEGRVSAVAFGHEFLRRVPVLNARPARFTRK